MKKPVWKTRHEETSLVYILIHTSVQTRIIKYACIYSSLGARPCHLHEPDTLATGKVISICHYMSDSHDMAKIHLSLGIWLICRWIATTACLLIRHKWYTCLTLCSHVWLSLCVCVCGGGGGEWLPYVRLKGRTWKWFSMKLFYQDDDGGDDEKQEEDWNNSLPLPNCGI